MIDYSLGFKTSFYIFAAVIGVFLIGFVLNVAIYLILKKSRPVWYVLGIDVLLIAFSSLLIIYPVLNFIGNISFFAGIEEIKSYIDYFTIRIISVILGIRIIHEIYNNFRSKVFSATAKPTVHTKDPNKLTLWVGKYKHWFFLTQFAIYSIPIFTLFYLQFITADSIVALALNLLLFNIIGDWGVVQKYITMFSGKILKPHYRVLEAYNICISVITIYLITAYCPWYIYIVAYFIYLCVLIWRFHSMFLITHSPQD